MLGMVMMVGKTMKRDRDAMLWPPHREVRRYPLYKE
jgi:hypothetical protein